MCCNSSRATIFSALSRIRTRRCYYLASNPPGPSLGIQGKVCLWAMVFMLMTIAEVERSIENLVKSGKMFGIPGGRREFKSPFSPGPARNRPKFGEYAHQCRLGHIPAPSKLTLAPQTPVELAGPNARSRSSLMAGLAPLRRISRISMPPSDTNPRAAPTRRSR